MPAKKKIIRHSNAEHPLLPVFTELCNVLAEQQPFILTLSKPARKNNLSPILQHYFNKESSLQKITLSAWNGLDSMASADCFTTKQHFTTPSINSRELLEEIVHEQFSQAHLQTPTADMYIRSSTSENETQLFLQQSKPSRQHWEKPTEAKEYIVTPDNALPLLQEIGICSGEGKIRAPMWDKYKQINNFIAIVLSTKTLKQWDKSNVLRITDAGCGKGYLSFALAYALRAMGFTVQLTGIDFNTDVIASCRATAANLDFSTAVFFAGSIIEQAQSLKTDILLALHACDTATDEALFIGIMGQAQLIIAAPCCHKFVNNLLRSQTLPPAAELLAKDGIGRERLADLLTDSMRRDILIEQGYSASLMEFTSPEHTLKNILIKAEKRSSGGKEGAESEFRDSFALWGVAPKLAELLHQTQNKHG